jgi:hemerythrin
MISWNDIYQIGIEEIDKQHNELFTYVTEMYRRFGTISDDALSRKDKLQFIPDIWRLRKHSFTHFIAEEEYMIKSRYPDYFTHKDLHNELITTIFDLENQLIDDEDGLKKELIMSFLEVLIQHVTKYDRKFGDYLRDSGVLAKMLIEKGKGIQK